VEKQYREGTLKAHMVTVLKAVQPEALTVQGKTRLAAAGSAAGRALTAGGRLQPAGMELFDISVPEKPKSISFFDCSGPTSRGVHQLWFCDGEYVHTASGAPDFNPTHPSDDQFYRCIDVRNPSKPVEIGRSRLLVAGEVRLGA